MIIIVKGYERFKYTEPGIYHGYEAKIYRNKWEKFWEYPVATGYGPNREAAVAHAKGNYREAQAQKDQGRVDVIYWESDD